MAERGKRGSPQGGGHERSHSARCRLDRSANQGRQRSGSTMGTNHGPKPRAPPQAPTTRESPGWTTLARPSRGLKRLPLLQEPHTARRLLAGSAGRCCSCGCRRGSRGGCRGRGLGLWRVHCFGAVLLATHVNIATLAENEQGQAGKNGESDSNFPHDEFPEKDAPRGKKEPS